MTADAFSAEMLREIERTFYRGAPARFFQDRDLLLQAVLLPVDYIHAQRDLVATPALYQSIVRKVVATIRDHGTPDPRRRFCLYFLKCMQTHLEHHGEGYLQKAKTSSALAGIGLRSLRQVETIEFNVALGQALSALRQRGGRKRAPAPADQGSLF